VSYRISAAGIITVLMTACATHRGPDPAQVFPALCQSEVCLPGWWLACDSLPVHPALPARGTPVSRLRRNEEFEVQAASTVVLVPGIVLVTRDTRQRHAGRETLFSAGDTLHVLDYLGEGDFNVRYRGEIIAVEAFWPIRQGSLPEYSADVLREQQSEFWLRIEARSGVRGWVLQDRGKMLDPLARTIATGAAYACT
jgi:hypothetical protein